MERARTGIGRVFPGSFRILIRTLGILVGIVVWGSIQLGLGPLPAAADEPQPSPAEAKQAKDSKAGPWIYFDAQTKATLRGLSAAGSGVVWVTGSEGTVRRTVDGGKTWTAPAPEGSESFEIRDVEAWGPDTVVLQVAGQPARFYRSIDGGKSYSVVYEHLSEAAFFDGFAFWPGEQRARGIAYSDPVDGSFLVATTEDSGQTWSDLSVDRFPEPREGEAGFAASGTGIAVAEGGKAWVGFGGPSARILHTEDYGVTWSFAETSLRSGAPSAGVFSVAFRSPTRGLAMGGDYRDESGLEGTLVSTHDGGKTWKSGSGLSGFRSCVVWVPSWSSGDEGGDTQGAWLATGPLGTDVSFDDGKTWKAFGSEGFHVLSLSPDGEVWAAGADGKIARLRKD